MNILHKLTVTQINCSLFQRESFPLLTGYKKYIHFSQRENKGLYGYWSLRTEPEDHFTWSLALDNIWKCFFLVLFWGGLFLWNIYLLIKAVSGKGAEITYRLRSNSPNSQRKKWSIEMVSVFLKLNVFMVHGRVMRKIWHHSRNYG